MNQDNQQQTQQMSQEELQQTLVLNLKDVQKVAKIERKTSKKPAIFVAIIGIALLFLGSGVQVVNNMKEKKAQEKMIEKRQDDVVRTSIDCIKTKLNNPTNTDDTYNFTYYFDNNNLTKAVKFLAVTPSLGKENVTEDVKKYKEEFKSLMDSYKGYDIRLIENDKGFSIIVEIDYKVVDPSELSEKQNKNAITAIDYKLGDSEEKVKEDMTKKEFNCK